MLLTSHPLRGCRTIVLTLLLGLMGLSALSASAQAPSIPSYDRLTLNHLDRIIANTPGISSVGIANGVNVSASGAVNVTASNGVRIPVPVTATATINKAALASAATKFIRGANVIGAAFTAYQVYDWVKTSGIATCAPPDFFCKPAQAGETVPASGRWMVGGWPAGGEFATAEAGCRARVALNGNSYRGMEQMSPDEYRCKYEYGILALVSRVEGTTDTCASGTTPNGAGGCTSTSSPGGPMTESEMETAIANVEWTADRSQKMRDALLADLPKARGIYTNADITPGMSIVNVVAAPVTTPRTTVKTDTVVTGDGRTLEVKTEEQIKIIPNLSQMNRVDSPSSLAQFKEEMTRFTGETDLATGIYKQTSQSVSTPTATAQATPSEQATGPTECGSPGKPKCAIDETGTPTTQAATDAMTAPKAELDKAKTDFITKIAEATSSDGKDTSLGWFPALPTGTCTPFVISPKLPAVDWCPVVPRIKDMMAWIWAMLTIFACIHLVHNTLQGK